MTSDSGLISQPTDSSQAIQELLDPLHQMQQRPQLATNPEELEALERDIRHHTDRLSSLLVGHHLQASLDADALKTEQDLLVSHWPRALHNEGKVTVWIRTAQGMAVAVRVTYSRRKGKRRAGKRYAGGYAGLVLLGFYDRCTPALAAEVSLLAAMLGSVAEAHEVLADRGVHLDTKTLRQIAYRYGARARLSPQMDAAVLEDSVAGRRVVGSSDGGRMRLREATRGRKTQKGCWRYPGAWREPKVLSMYVVEAEGKREARFAPVMAATLKGPDAMVGLLRTSVQRLHIPQADRVLCIADGAPWIGKRVPALVETLGLGAEQVDELLDFSHAVQHWAQVSALRKDWRAKARSRWRNLQRRLLLQGQVEQVITAVRELCRGRNSKAIRPHRDYFVKNQSRLASAELSAMGLPMGSGAIESTVRRVITLRLKGPSIFWCRASAEAILLLCSYDKAGRWKLLKRMATSHTHLLEA